MNRYRKVLALAVLTLAMTGLALPHTSGAQQPIVIKLANVQPVDHVIQVSLRKFAELVAERTNKQIQVQIYPASQLGTDQQTLEGVQLGTVQMVETSSASLDRFLPDVDVFAAPYIWKDIDHMLKTVRGPIGHSLTDRLLKSQGMRVLDFGWFFGNRHLTTKSKPIYKPEDLKGMKIRVQPTPVYADTVRAMGGNPTLMDWNEVYLALQSGVIDGQENPPTMIYSGKVFEVQKYIMLTGHILQNNMLVIGEKFYQGLSPAFQQALSQAAVDAGNFQSDLAQKQEKADLDALKNKGMTFIQPDVNAFREATKDVWKKHAEEWEPGLYEKIQRFQADLK